MAATERRRSWRAGAGSSMRSPPSGRRASPSRSRGWGRAAELQLGRLALVLRRVGTDLRPRTARRASSSSSQARGRPPACAGTCRSCCTMAQSRLPRLAPLGVDLRAERPWMPVLLSKAMVRLPRPSGADPGQRVRGRPARRCQHADEPGQLLDVGLTMRLRLSCTNVSTVPTARPARRAPCARFAALAGQLAGDRRRGRP